MSLLTRRGRELGGTERFPLARDGGSATFPQEKRQLTRALGRRAVVRGNVQRNTLHLHSAREYPLYHAALRTPRLDWLAGSWKHRYSEQQLQQAQRTGR